MNLVSQTYKSVLKETHAKLNDTWGGGHSIDKLPQYEVDMKAKDVSTILDYGCANGKFKVYMNANKPHYTVYEYDPGIAGKDALPQSADYIVCCDVMEHIEPELLDNVMLHLQSLMLKGGFFNISTKDAVTLLSDGSNAHKLVRDGEWWVDVFKQYFDLSNIDIGIIETNFRASPKSSQ
jgi:2-polyprenyl-3-methyl-5-hydroxy-6-metoxy-1,4-benzoquinol methylase